MSKPIYSGWKRNRASLLAMLLQSLMLSSLLTQKVPVVEETFSNGMRVLLVQREDETTVSGGWVAHVGSSNERPGITGIAYLFDVASGTLLTTFANPTPSPGDQFGASLAMAGNVVAIGSWLDDTAAPGGGAVYVFGNDASPPGSTTTTTLPPTTTTVTTTSSTVSTTATSTTSTATTTSATTSSSAPAGTTTTTTSTATTLVPPVVACATVCDDHDPCTLDACAEAGCIHTPEIGFDAVVCRLDTLDTVLHGLPHLALGGRRTALALQRQVARARRLVDAARTGGRAARKLLRAERALARFAVTVRRSMLSGRIARVAAGNVLALAADATQQLPALRAAVR